MSRIKDISLAPSGEMKINWVERNMPVLRGIGEDFKREKPFAGMKVALSVHLEAKTAYLCRVMEMGGAKMYVTGSNPLSTQDDVAAALVSGGMNVFAEYGCSMEQYEQCLEEVLKVGPNIIIDDGGDLVHLMHTKYTDLIPNVIGGCEETTTGINRLRIMSRNGGPAGCGCVHNALFRPLHAHVRVHSHLHLVGAECVSCEASPKGHL